MEILKYQGELSAVFNIIRVLLWILLSVLILKKLYKIATDKKYVDFLEKKYSKLEWAVKGSEEDLKENRQFLIFTIILVLMVLELAL